MSRRSLQWKKAIAQAGGDASKVIPHHAKGTGMRGMGVPKELLGEIGKGTVGSGRGNRCTADMRPEKQSRFMKLK